MEQQHDIYMDMEDELYRWDQENAAEIEAEENKRRNR